MEGTKDIRFRLTREWQSGWLGRLCGEQDLQLYALFGRWTLDAGRWTLDMIDLKLLLRLGPFLLNFFVGKGRLHG